MKILLLVPLLFCSCNENTPVETRTTANSVSVDLLFEHNGIKMYRFQDNGRYHYYTDARGETHSTYQTGSKHKTTHAEAIPTVK